MKHQIDQSANNVRFNFDNGLTVSMVINSNGTVSAQTVRITESERSGVRRIKVIRDDETMGADAFADYLREASTAKQLRISKRWLFDNNFK